MGLLDSFSGANSGKSSDGQNNNSQSNQQQNNSKELTDERLAKFIAVGFGVTGVEGGFESVSCSTAGDYPSMGISQWEGNGIGDNGTRGNDLLSMIPGGEVFMFKPYSQIDVNKLAALLDSPNGQKAQTTLLAQDAAGYVAQIKDAGITDPRCIIYIGMWCPTGTACAVPAGQKGNNVLSTTHQYFHDTYYVDAGFSSDPNIAAGYAHRAELTYDYVSQVDLNKDPDPTMVINMTSARKELEKFAKSSDKGFRFVPKGKDTVEVIKLPEGKTFCEPIYPDYITVSDKVPTWCLSQGSAQTATQQKESEVKDPDGNVVTDAATKIPLGMGNNPPDATNFERQPLI